jgi:hypothetical protein
MGAVVVGDKNKPGKDAGKVNQPKKSGPEEPPT